MSCIIEMMQSRRGRERDRNRMRGGLMAMKEENEEMQAKLKERRERQRHGGGQEGLLDRLANRNWNCSAEINKDETQIKQKLPYILDK